MSWWVLQHASDFAADTCWFFSLHKSLSSCIKINCNFQINHHTNSEWNDVYWYTKTKNVPEPTRSLFGRWPPFNVSWSCSDSSMTLNTRRLGAHQYSGVYFHLSHAHAVPPPLPVRQQDFGRLWFGTRTPPGKQITTPRLKTAPTSLSLTETSPRWTPQNRRLTSADILK